MAVLCELSDLLLLVELLEEDPLVAVDNELCELGVLLLRELKLLGVLLLAEEALLKLERLFELLEED